MKKSKFDDELEIAYEKLIRLDQKIKIENRSGKKIDPLVRSQYIKKIDAYQKRVDDLRYEIMREAELQIAG